LKGKAIAHSVDRYDGKKLKRGLA